MPGDLHNHTTYSDGSVPVARLPLMAARVGLDAMAISDHDTLRSVQYAYDHPVGAFPPQRKDRSRRRLSLNGCQRSVFLFRCGTRRKAF